MKSGAVENKYVHCMSVDCAFDSPRPKRDHAEVLFVNNESLHMTEQLAHAHFSDSDAFVSLVIRHNAVRPFMNKTGVTGVIRYG